MVTPVVLMCSEDAPTGMTLHGGMGTQEERNFC